MEKLTRILSKRLGFILTLAFLVCLWGLYSAWQIKKDYLPDINNPILMVTVKMDANTNHDQQAAALNKDLTGALKEVDGLQSVESTLYPQGVFLSLTFPQNADINKAKENIKAALASVSLPAGTSQPEVTVISSNAFPFMQVSLRPSSAAGAMKAADSENVRKQLEQLPGVEKVQTTGNGQEGYVVTLDPHKMAVYGLTLDSVKKTLTSRQKTLPAGTVQMSDVHMILNVRPSPVTEKSLEQIPLVKKSGKEVVLQDVATVQKSTVNVQTIARTQGRASVLINLYKTPSADVTAVSRAAEQKVDQFNKAEKGLSLKVLFDNGQTAADAIHGLWRETVLGCLFSIVCVFLFFRQWRATAAILFSLPICFFVSVSILKDAGVTLNLLTASGFIVAMGRVVDDSIVVMDNMYRRTEISGKMSIPVLAEGAKEMIPAVAASTLTTIAVYLPLALTGTMIGHAFSGFAWAVTIALVCSFLVALLIVPPFTARVWSRSFVPLAPQTEKRAAPILRRLLKKRKLLFSTFCILLVGCGIGAFFIPVNILPRTQSQAINVQIECPEGSTLAQMDGEVRGFEATLAGRKDIQTYSSTLGSVFTPTFDDVFDQVGGWIQQGNIANVSITPKKGMDTDKLITSLKDDIKQMPTTAAYTVSSQQISGDDSQVKIVLSGLNEEALIRSANLLKSKLQTITGLQIYNEGDQNDLSRFTVQLNDEKMKSLGIDKQKVLNSIDDFTDKSDRLQMVSGDGTVPVELDKPSSVSLSYQQGTDAIQTLLLKLGKLSFKGKNQQAVKLADIASLKVRPSVVTSEKDGAPIAIITGNITTPDIGTVTKQINRTLNDSRLPKGIHVDFGGIPEQVRQLIASAAFAGTLSILLVFLIMTSIFKGLRAPLAVLSSLPFALIGSVLFLFIFRQSWTIGSLVGLVMLVGIVATNGIVLVDRLERLRRQGKPIDQVLIEGTASRVRPILMTASTTVLTLLPLVFSSPDGTLISQTLGLVVVGGMITATLTSLVVIPTFYHWLFAMKIRKGRLNAADGREALKEG